MKEETLDLVVGNNKGIIEMIEDGIIEEDEIDSKEMGYMMHEKLL